MAEMAQKSCGSPPFQHKSRTRRATGTGSQGESSPFQQLCVLLNQAPKYNLGIYTEKIKEKNIQSQQDLTTGQYLVSGCFGSTCFHLNYYFSSDIATIFTTRILYVIYCTNSGRLSLL